MHFTNFSSALAAFLIHLLLIPVSTNSQQREKYSEKELAALQSFRSAVNSFLYLEYQHEDAYLINWLRTKNLDVEKAKALLERSLKFRKENGIDKITSSNEMRELEKSLPSALGSAVDKEGSPACIQIFSKWDIRKQMLSGKGEAMRRFPFYVFESMTTLMRNSNSTQWVLLVDLSNFNLRTHACIACLPFYVDIVTTYETHYPSTAKLLLAINAPSVFETPLRLMTPLMTPPTKKAFKVFGLDRAEWQSFLLQHFNPDQLTKKHGGTALNYPPSRRV